MNDTKELLTAQEAAVKLNVPASWMYYAARTKKFPSVRMGRHVRFRATDVADWIEKGGAGDE